MMTYHLIECNPFRLIILLSTLPRRKLENIDSNAFLYNVSTFDHDPGIYYEYLGKLRIYNDAWNLITYVNLKTQDEHISVLENILTNTENICNSFKTIENVESTICSISMRNVKREFNSIKEQQDIFSQLLGHKPYIRVKRGFLDVVGKAAKILFGTLDDDDATYFNDKIQKVTNDEKQLIELIKEQSIIVKSTIQNFNSTINELNNNEIVLSDNLIKLETIIHKDTDQIQINTLREIINEHFAILIYTLEQIKLDTMKIIEAILFAQQGIIHPSILSPKRLVNELQQIIKYLPKDLDFPLSITMKNVAALLQLINLNAAYVKDTLMIIIEIPLVPIHNFNLYHMIPLPIRSADMNLFILPVSEYIAINTNKQNYLIFKDLKDCKNMNDYYICKQSQPIYLTHKNEVCEVKLYLNPNINLMEHCDVRITKIVTKVFHQLIKRNSWIFLLNSPETLTISCKQSAEPFDIVIKDSGIITLNENCKAYSFSINLSPSRSFSNTIKLDYMPEMNLNISNLLPSNNKINITELKLDHIYRSHILHLEDLNIASHKLSKIEETANNILKSKETIYHYSILYYVIYVICVFIIIIIIVKIIIKLRKKRKDCSCPRLCLTFRTSNSNIVENELSTIYSDIIQPQPRRSIRSIHDDEIVNEMVQPQPRRSERIKHRTKDNS